MEEQGRAYFDEFERNGFAVVRNVVPTALLDEALAHVRWLIKRNPTIRPEQLHHPLMRTDAFWVHLIAHPCLVELVKPFLGEDIVCFTSHYICKPPHDGHAVLWHQDGAYWHLEPANAITLWVSLDGSNRTNGCLQMLPSTKDAILRPIEVRSSPANMLGSTTHVAEPELRNAALVELEAGDVSLHNSRIVHGSGPNTSTKWRKGLDIGYMAANTKILNKQAYLSPFLVAGRPHPDGTDRLHAWPQFSPSDSIPFAGLSEYASRAKQMNALIATPRGCSSSSETADRTVEDTQSVIAQLNAGTLRDLQGDR